MAPPTAYRVLFFILDIFLPVFGAFAYVFAADTMVLSSFTSSPVSWPPSPEMRVVLDGSAGWHAAFAVVQITVQFLRTDDLLMWRALSAGTLCQDLLMLLGFARALNMEGRLYEFANWTGADWGNFGGYGAIALLRVAFLLGVGVGGASRKVVRKQA